MVKFLKFFFDCRGEGPVILLWLALVFYGVQARCALRKGSSAEPVHVFNGTKAISKIYNGSALVWGNTNAPNITAFSVSPDTIDLDTRPTGNVSFTLAVTGRSGETTNAQVVRLPGGQNVGPTYQGQNGANISETLPNIPQPNQTTTYRLFATNAGGAAHRDTTLTVTQNPALSGLTTQGRSGGQAAPQGVTIVISGTVTGYPRPDITINQSFNNGNALSDRHFTSNGTNSWAFTADWFYPSTTSRVFTVTATNSSGSASQNVTFN